MQFLVTMTTQVPDGVTAEEVDGVRAREAAHSRELATKGLLLRLWRPPLQPGEWRTLGLFDTGDRDELETVLASMPLRIWREDEVTPLSSHPNDPLTPVIRHHDATEFLTFFTLTVDDRDDTGTFAQSLAAEARMARQLAEQEYLIRLWTLPGRGRALGLWQAGSDEAIRSILFTLPLRPWLEIETIPLSAHPNDPAAVPGRLSR